MKLKEFTISANTGLDAIKRAPIVEEDTGLKCIRIQDISQGKDFDDWGNTLTTDRDFHKFRLKIGDLLVARTGATVGVSFLVKENYNAVFNNGSIRLRFNNKIDTAFVYYIFKSKEFLQYIENVSCVATQPNLRVENLLRFNIPDFSISIQQKIASALSAYDNLIENNNKRIRLLEQMAENLYKEWFVRFRFPGHEKAEFENGLPKGWKVETMSNLLVMHCNGGWGEEMGSDKYCTAAHVIRGTDIEDIKTSQFTNIPLRYHKENDLFNKHLEIDDIILELSNGNINNIGRTLIVDDLLLSKCKTPICASFCKLLRFDNSLIAIYVYYILNYMQKKGLLNYYKNCGTNGINNFNFKRFLKMKVIIPNDMSLITILKEYQKQMMLLRNQTYILSRQRDLLLPRLMSGKLEVKV